MTTAIPDDRPDRGPVPVAPLPWRARQPASLPVPLTPLLGRDGEVAAVCALLHGDYPRLVTLTGPGGVGKTRLALHVAETEINNFSDGVIFVALAFVRSPEAVVPAIAEQLGVRGTGDGPLADRLRAFLQDKTLLLVLDNV